MNVKSERGSGDDHEDSKWWRTVMSGWPVGMASFINGVRSTMSLYRFETSAFMIRRGFDLDKESDPATGREDPQERLVRPRPPRAGRSGTLVGPRDMLIVTWRTGQAHARTIELRPGCCKAPPMWSPVACEAPCQPWDVQQVVQML